MNFDTASIVVELLRTGRRKTVLRGGTFGRYLPAGYLAYLNNGTLFAVPFDLKRLETVGTPVPVVEGVSGDGNGAAQAAFSDGGTLAYLPAQGVSGEAAIFWMARGGKTAPLRNTPGVLAAYRSLALQDLSRAEAVRALDH